MVADFTEEEDRCCEMVADGDDFELLTVADGRVVVVDRVAGAVVRTVDREGVASRCTRDVPVLLLREETAVERRSLVVADLLRTADEDLPELLVALRLLTVAGDLRAVVADLLLSVADERSEAVLLLTVAEDRVDAERLLTADEERRALVEAALASWRVSEEATRAEEGTELLRPRLIACRPVLVRTYRSSPLVLRSGREYVYL